MRKSFLQALPALACSLAALTGPSAASAAGTITVDQTIEQQCTYGMQGTFAAFSLPIRVQFTVPQTLLRGETLSIDQRRVSLPSPSALYAAVRERSDSGLIAQFQGGGRYRGASVAITGNDPVLVAPDIGATWNTPGSGPAVLAGPTNGGFGPALPGLDVPVGDVAVHYTGYDAYVSVGESDFFRGYDLKCKPAAPVLLATIAVSNEPGPPIVDALSDLQSPLVGGATVRLQGRNFNGADAVSFGGIAATSFSVKSDTVIDAAVPAHAAGTDLQVAVSRSGQSSADTPADDFDFVSPPAAGSFDTLLQLTCTDNYVTPRTHTVGLRLRGKVPASVQPGTTFAFSDLRATVLSNETTMSYGRPVARYAYNHLGPIQVALQGATTTSGALGDGWLSSAQRRTQFGEPVALEGAFDQPWAVPQPPNAITAAAAAGGEVVVSFADARPIYFGEYGGGSSAFGPQMKSCAIAEGSGSGVIARIPVRLPPVDQSPVVTKVTGFVVARVGGIVGVTGQRLTGGKVRIGGRTAARIATIGSTIYVAAPALAAGTYEVVVTTPQGTSAATAATNLKYPRLF